MKTADPLGDLVVPGWRVETIGETTSTNQMVAARAAAGEPSGLAIIADHQVAGRGRRGNRWESPPGSALLLSALLRPDASISRWPRLAVAAAVATCQAIARTTSLRPFIKWPNDILIDGCKVAGILLESRAPDQLSPGWVIIGIGVNVHARTFPLNLRYPATSLALAGGHAPARATLASELLQAITRNVDLALSADWPDVLAAYADHDALAGRLIRAENQGNIIDGRACGLDPEGGLVLQPLDGSPPQILRDAHSLTLLEPN